MISRNLHIDDIADLADRSRAVLRWAGVRSLGDAANNTGNWRNHSMATAVVVANVEDVLIEHGVRAPDSLAHGPKERPERPALFVNIDANFNQVDENIVLTIAGRVSADLNVIDNGASSGCETLKCRYCSHAVVVRWKVVSFGRLAVLVCDINKLVKFHLFSRINSPRGACCFEDQVHENDDDAADGRSDGSLAGGGKQLVTQQIECIDMAGNGVALFSPYRPTGLSRTVDRHESGGGNRGDRAYGLNPRRQGRAAANPLYESNFVHGPSATIGGAK
ncbi:hypothetical protein [Caulobacter zeae]|uniref:hypothetical protein n=1 Tax=Caulobacter zeae TaxID=2055137 RepID=UPI00105677AD|nr:hypothetical protein [Caulobacter zeae]